MIARPLRSDDAAARLGRAMALHAFAAGVSLAIEGCRARPWFSATFEGVQVELALTAAGAEAAQAWLATLDDADLPMRGHVAMAPAVNAVTPAGDALWVELTVLVLIDG